MTACSDDAARSLPTVTQESGDYDRLYNVWSWYKLPANGGRPLTDECIIY